MSKRKKFKVTLTLSVPEWMRPEAAELEIKSRINEMCGYANGYGKLDNYHELNDGDMRAMSIQVRKAT